MEESEWGSQQLVRGGTLDAGEYADHRLQETPEGVLIAGITFDTESRDPFEGWEWFVVDGERGFTKRIGGIFLRVVIDRGDDGTTDTAIATVYASGKRINQFGGHGDDFEETALADVERDWKEWYWNPLTYVEKPKRTAKEA